MLHIAACPTGQQMLQPGLPDALQHAIGAALPCNFTEKCFTTHRAATGVGTNNARNKALERAKLITDRFIAPSHLDTQVSVPNRGWVNGLGRNFLGCKNLKFCA
jgi:hypothetical protein